MEIEQRVISSYAYGLFSKEERGYLESVRTMRYDVEKH